MQQCNKNVENALKHTFSQSVFSSFDAQAFSALVVITEDISGVYWNQPVCLPVPVTSNFSFSHNVFHSYIFLVRQNVALCVNGLTCFLTDED